MRFFKRFYFQYLLKRYAIKHHLWEDSTKNIALLRGLDTIEKTRLRELSSIFLHQKAFTGIGINLTQKMQIVVAAQACLPVLNLGIDRLDGWTEIIIYPRAFCISRDERDENGIVHHKENILSGEAWSRGPLILSWEDIEQDLQIIHPGHNVIIHEIAHKLDMLNGKANGMPPLHLDMQPKQWTAAFTAAYQQLNKRLQHHHRVCVNPYAATSPAEFFAVISEYFFAAPEILYTHFPAVYQQLQMYYRQDTRRQLAR